MTIGVISAMDSEHRQLVERLQEKKVADYGHLHYVEGLLGGNHVILTQCGIGKVNERLVYHDVWCGEGNEYGQVQGLPAAYEGCASLLEHALSLNNAGPESRICKGLICTGDRFITDRAELGAIKHRFPAGLAVDMESAAIAQVCHLYGIPFLSFRIISDTPGVEDHSAQYADFWGTMAERSFLSTWAFLSTLPDSL